MKATEWRRLSGVVADVLPEYQPMKFGFVHRETWLASGFYVDSSAFSSTAFYVEAFVMPRFIPADSIYFDYGFRLNGRWEGVGPELADAVVAAKPELSQRATLEGLIVAASDWRRNINHAELRLCAAVIADDQQSFERLKRIVSEFVPEVPWEAAVRDRCAELATLVNSGGYSAARTKLATRRTEVDRLFA